MPKQKGFAPLLILLGGVLLIVLIGVAIYYKNSSKFAATPPVPSPLLKQSQNPGFASIKNEKLIIKSDQIIVSTNGKEEILFTNVANISDVRYGPDGKTVHFKQKNPEERINSFCANIGDPFKHAEIGYESPPPVVAPWDFQKVGHYGTVTFCGGTKSGGFLKSKNYFTYIEITPQKKAPLYLEDLSTKEKIKIDLPDALASELSPQSLNDASTITENKFMGTPIKGYNGNLYLYPQGDLMTGERLLIGVNRILLVVNFKTRQFLKEIPFSEHSPVVLDSYGMVNKNSQSYVVIVGAWEGPEVYEKIIDISSDNIKEVPLYPNIQSHYSRIFFNIEPIIWETDKVRFNVIDSTDITKSLSQNILKKQEILMSDDKTTQKQWDLLNAEAVTYLKFTTPNYSDYVCALEPGQLSGQCFGLIKKDMYQYTSEKGLQKL